MEHAFGYILDKKIFRKGFLNNPDREIGEVKDSEENSLFFFQERFRALEKKVEDLEEKIVSSENKGSFLAKLKHIKETLPEYDGLGDFENLFDRLTRQEDMLNELIAQNRIKNLEIKKNLLTDLEGLKDHFNLREATEKINEIREKWIRTGAVSGEYKDDIENKFKFFIEYFQERKKSFYEDRKKMFDSYVSQYRQIIDQVKKITGDRSAVNTYELNQLREKWKQLPKLPSKIFLPLRNEFNFALKKIPAARFDRTTDTGTALTDEIRDKKKDLLRQLEEMSKTFSYPNKEAEIIKTNWKKFPKVFSKEVKLLDKKAYRLFDKIKDLNYVYSLGLKKNAGFESLQPARKIELMIKYLRDIRLREERELEKVKMNSGIIYSHDKKVQGMLVRQLELQQQRIEVKSGLIEELSNGLIRLIDSH